ncbi:DUF4214 domain-containing protein [Roseomonas sp. BN140053]|uniref:DUF4214 domain-containing protein n=1 Tax=Roseomonas sp. BN140053 TaxID=3391898 RepID=UPI0039E7E8F7
MASITGTDNPEVLNGTEGSDVINALAGDDQVFGGGGNDRINGGLGNDFLNGQFGADAIYGQAANDTVQGGEGDDYLDGGDGNDVLLGQGGNDELRGDVGDDTLVGDVGGDELRGGTGVDLLLGGQTGDFLSGDDGNDWLNPGNGTGERVYGGVGIDTLMRDVPVRLAPNFFPGLNPASSDTSFSVLNSIEAYEFVDGRYTRDQQDISAQVYRLYQAAFNRVPDAHGLSFQLEAVEDGILGRAGGASLSQVAGSFVGSPEFAATYGVLDDNGFVAQLYRNVLHREGSGAEIAYHVNSIPTIGRGGVLLGFSESPENINNTRGAVVNGLWVRDWEAAQVARLYDTVLGRLPDAAGLAYHDERLESGAATLRDVALGFVAAPEFQARYGTLDDRGFASALYQNALDRAATPAELDYYEGVLRTTARVDVVLGFSESPEHIALLAPTMPNDGFLLA